MSTQVCGVSGRRYEDRAVVVLPTQIIHPIDQDSPFYCLHPSELASMDLELVVTMEAVVEPSGNTTIALSSYTPDELIWGWRFESCVDYDRASRLDIFCEASCQMSNPQNVMRCFQELLGGRDKDQRHLPGRGDALDGCGVCHAPEVAGGRAARQR